MVRPTQDDPLDRRLYKVESQMESIFTNAQISRDSLMRPLLILLLVGFHLNVSGQTSLSSSNKKAVKLYNKASDLIRKRNFDEGIENYKKAVKKDPQFSEAYYRLGSAYTRDKRLLRYSQ